MDKKLGADPEFFNTGAQTHEDAKQRVSMIEYLQLLLLSNCILTVTHAHAIDILDLYMN